MVVKIRFGGGSRVARGRKKNARLALLAASFLTLIAICLGAMGGWRLAEDLDFAGEFLFTDGLLSHWQVWFAAAAAVQIAAWKLTGYYRSAAVEEIAQEIQSETLTAIEAETEAETEIPASTPIAVRR